MQKFILLRGHQGSGKSTFAEQKIAEFQKDFLNAQIVHIENDKELTDENVSAGKPLPKHSKKAWRY